MVLFKNIQAQSSAKPLPIRTRRRRVKVPASPRKTVTPPPPPQVPPPPQAIAQVSCQSASPNSCATMSTPAIVSLTPVTTNSVCIKFDPLQIALDTFDSVVAQSLCSSSNLNDSVTVHIYRSLFKETLTKQVELFTSPLNPSNLIEVVTLSLKAIGLL